MAARRGGLTKTQQLRQAKSAAFVREYAQKQETAAKPRHEPITRKRRPPPPEPKKVDFSRPGLTKAMLARMKHAEKFKEDYDKKKHEEAAAAGRRQPRRTAPPVGGDARAGRERRRTRSPSAGPSRASPSRRRRRSPEVTAVSEKTGELARSMNADVIQAEPVGEGPIENIVIPPGAVSPERATIVSIPRPQDTIASDVANRSIRVISETLDEQDAAEAVAVQSRLADLQQARRDFVIAVANVGGNAVNIGEDAVEPARPRGIYRVPDITDERFRIEYGRDHPTVQAAREFAQRTMASLREREAQREYERLQKQPEDFLVDIGFEEDLEEEVAPWEDDEDLLEMTPPSPRMRPYEYEPFDPDALERFFNIEKYPTVTPPRAPPCGRDQIHPDLWELEDPWYRPPPPEDLMEFDLIDFD